MPPVVAPPPPLSGEPADVMPLDEPAVGCPAFVICDPPGAFPPAPPPVGVLLHPHGSATRPNAIEVSQRGLDKKRAPGSVHYVRTRGALSSPVCLPHHSPPSRTTQFHPEPPVSRTTTRSRHHPFAPKFNRLGNPPLEKNPPPVFLTSTSTSHPVDGSRGWGLITPAELFLRQPAIVPPAARPVPLGDQNDGLEAFS